ncbi:MAG TPA: hypothetical protein VMT66_05855 [Steroidobacteraceae bacterium]|nr:hypothetical protein [Steroidobacteraceae bacterium]
MRLTVGCCFAVLAAITSVSFAAPESAPPGPASTPTGSARTYYLRGYYRMDTERPVWQDSDSSPWSQVAANAPWVNARMIKWGYVPFTHDSKNYYCLIDDKPRTGSHVVEATFMCGDAAIVQSMFLQNGSRPNTPMIGGGPPLENSLRPAPPAGGG